MNYRQVFEGRREVALPEIVAREIDEILNAAKADNRTLHTGSLARRIAVAHPELGLDHDALCDGILALAIAARVPTQLNSAL